MSALQKVAWVELVVSLTAISVALALYPWIGDRASGALGILGLLGACPLFMIKRQARVISDERDREIELKSKFWGFGVAWMFLSLSVLAVAMWHSWSDQEIPARYVIALVYIQFAICFAMKGAYSLVLYGGGRRAT